MQVFFDRETTFPYYRALMSKGTVLKRLPKFVEPRKLAVARAQFDGVLDASDLPRLANIVQAIACVGARLSFSINDEGKRVILGNLTGTVELECQRCLGNLPLELDVPIRLIMVWDDDQAKAQAKSSDPWIVGEGEEDLHFVLEEELLLALPVVAYHEHNCIDSSLLSSSSELAAEPASKSNPFRVLEQLKDKKPRT